MREVSQEYDIRFDAMDVRAKLGKGDLATRIVDGNIKIETITDFVEDMTGRVAPLFLEYRFTITGTARPDPDGIAYQISINPEES